MVKNGYKSVSLVKPVMDFFDERILVALKDGKPRVSPRFWAKWASAITLCASS